MSEKKPSELLELAYQVARTVSGPGAMPMLMVIRRGKLQMIIPGKQYREDIYIMNYNQIMLTTGLSGNEWHLLCAKLMKHRKEIKN